MSFNRPFKQGGGEESGDGSSASFMGKYSGNERDSDRKKQWKSFLADLEVECMDDETSDCDQKHSQILEKRKSSSEERQVIVAVETQAKNEVNEDTIDNDQSGNNPSWNDNNNSSRGSSVMHSLYMQQIRGNYYAEGSIMSNNISSSMIEQQQQQTPIITRAPVDNNALPLNPSLPDWIAHYRKLNTQTINNHSVGRSIIGGIIDKLFLEKAARIALSLAKMIERRSLSDATIIVIDNIIVVSDTTKSDSGEVEFVNDDDDVITSNTAIYDDSQKIASSSSEHSQQKAIHALGVIFYEMFTQGSSPPFSSADEDRQHPHRPTTPAASFSEPSSFHMALQITGDGDDADDDDHNRDSSGTKHRQKQHRRMSREGERHSHHGHYTTLQLAGVPPSISRLVADMLENEDDSSEAQEEGSLFRRDQPTIASLSDVVSDLQQMVDDPNSYLHDSLLMRLEPVISENKLYGRTDELHRCLEVAGSIISQDQSSSQQQQKQQQQQAIVISGFSGCGKTFLVKEVRACLEKKGNWQYLHCKFDQEARPQPLSTIASAFDNFLVDVVCRLDCVGQGEVITRINGLLDDDDVNALGQLIPSLKKLAREKDTLSSLSSPSCSIPGLLKLPKPNDEISFNTRDAAASKCRLHRLMGLLANALAEQKRPLLICFDDLQWADIASLELINSLLSDITCAEVDVGSQTATTKNEGPHILFIGCFRSNDVAAAGTGALDTCIQTMKDCRTITLEEIHLEGLSSDDVNDLVSEALCYPRRLTRSLSNLIHQKSTGNPLFVKELLNSLATGNLLTYSLSRHRWIWDEDEIEVKSVSNEVADLLTYRLQRLPEGVLSGLQVMSCFGQNVSLDILAHVRDNMRGSSDIVAGLDLAIEELLITKADLGKRSAVYSFVHDTIQTTVYQGIEQRERVRMMKEIADILIAVTSDDERRDVVLFIIVDLINRAIGLHNNTPNANDRMHYAGLNLLACQKAIQTPDLSSAFEYIESGISFLDDGHWKHEYDLSLALFNNAAGVACSLGKSDQMTTYLNEVFANARCYEDKIDSMSVLIQSLIIAGKAGVAMDHSLKVLEHIGESLPTNLDKEAIERELIETHKCVQQILPSSLDTIPVMEDNLKIKAMHILNLCLWSSHHQKSILFVVVSCRMVRLTASHGLNLYSPCGIAALAHPFTSVLRNYTEGYKLGKLALALNKSPKLVGSISLLVTALASVFEPLQAVLPTILEDYKIALKYGTMHSACALAMSYVCRAFFSGSHLASFHKELAVFCHQMSRHNQIRPYVVLVSVSNAIVNLSGEPAPGFCDNVSNYEDNEENLSQAIKKQDIALCEVILTIQIAENVIFRRIDLAEKIVRQYQDFIDLHAGGIIKRISIIRTFYSGLVAFQCFRETNDRYWMDQGMKAIKVMEIWTNECNWNFENKMLLLNAEYHFSIGDFDKATEGYHLSLISSRKHRFLCEEAIANELAAYFHLKKGMEDLSSQFMKRAIKCYQSWGAVKKAETLK